MDRVAEHNEENQKITQAIVSAIASGDQISLIGSVALSLFRIAEAQEELVALAKMDLEEAINQAVEDRSQEVAADMVAEQTKRSFIGKRQG